MIRWDETRFKYGQSYLHRTAPAMSTTASRKARMARKVTMKVVLFPDDVFRGTSGGRAQQLQINFPTPVGLQ